MENKQFKEYTFCGLRWKQTELTLSQIIKARKISNVTLEEISKCTTFGDALKILTESKTLPKLFNLFLQPSYSGVRQRAQHVFMRIFKLYWTPGMLYGDLTPTEAAEVMQDFFSLNTTFLKRFTNMAQVLESLTTTPDQKKEA